MSPHMPPAEPPADFLSLLKAAGLLTSDQVNELSTWMALPGTDVQTVAREINRRGWLTLFQLREVFNGRAADLTVGPYALIDLLGEGGMGRVYLANHNRLGRSVALKVIRKEKLSNPMTLKRFHQEIQAVAQLSHPNVVLAFDAAEASGTHYLAMEYVEGQTLTQMVVTAGPMPAPVACEYVRQAAIGLQHAFERGLVHRDVKPSNIMVAKTGSVKVLDLGLALLNEQVTGGEEANRITQEGYVIGTPDFLAPEQARDAQRVDTRADVYSLGATLYYLLAARVPYDGRNPTEKLLRHVSDPPPQLLHVRPDAPPELDAVIQWMMAKDPAGRPQTPIQVAMALAPFCTGTAQHPPAPRLPAVPQPPAGSSSLFRLPTTETPAQVRERQRDVGTGTGWLVGLVAVVFLAVVGMVLFQWLGSPAGPPPVEYVNPFGMKFVLLPPGTYTRGSPDSDPARRPEEGPAHEVVLTAAWYMGTTEVTNAQYTLLTGESPSRTVSRGVSKSAELPVERVTWDAAVAFCDRLNKRDTGRRRGWVYRLPTEAEWEYACRAGTSTPFAFGDRLAPEHKLTFTSEEKELQPDGSAYKPPTGPGPAGKSAPNGFGLYDLHGNVAEWCSDYYARTYSPGAQTDPTGPKTGDIRTVRGGGYKDTPERLRSAARSGLPPDSREAWLGFRVVLAPVTP